MNLPIQVIRVRSRAADKEYYSAFPQADTDMATNGLLILVSVQKAEIHLYMAHVDEYPHGPYLGSLIRARKENELQKRNDLVGFSVVLDERALGWSCCQFAYTDAIVRNGYADAVHKLSLAEFQDAGGSIIDSRY